MKKMKSLLGLFLVLIIISASCFSTNAADIITPIPESQDVVTMGYNPFANAVPSRSIIGDDDRVPIYNTTSYPYSAIAHLNMNFSCGCSDYGSGFMISKNCMLTMGHSTICKKHGDDATSITATFGIQLNSGYWLQITATPSNSIIYHNPQFTGNQKNYDYGYVVFNTNIGNTTGWFGLASRSDSVLDGMSISITGYEDQEAMRSGNGKITSTATNRIKYDVDTSERQSGAPVYFNDPSIGYLVVGIHTHGTDLINWKNSGWRITSTFINELRTLGYVS